MLVLPKQFDSNEWFIIISLVFGYGLVCLLPQRFPKSITFLVMMFSLIIVKITDFLVGAPPLDLYDFNDTKMFDLMDLFTWFVFPPFGYFYLYFYDKWRIRGMAAALYIFLWAVFSVGFEWISVITHVFTYKGWKLFYSFPLYLTVLCMYLLFFRFATYYFHKKGAR